MTNDELLDLLTQAVSFKYPTDAVRPGVIVSSLRNGSYYVAVHRFGNTVKNKEIVHKATCISLSEALKKVSVQVVGKQGTNPVDKLRDALAK